ncbi:hypothetical protein Tsubulata_034182 [Turnera subulata]|uniref:RING-type domain-containing protein n=1 Tax=Turnera subulata TaxID=218843 RepID=A0A9Q0GII4_9ROSI|nr:hypothetical protein Tsubulata_034182 [Turnera subulata]
MHELVLEKSQPHEDIESLTIKGYGGKNFPLWLTDSNSLSSIVSICLKQCTQCSSLPPFGQLPSLKHLEIEGLDLGVEFYSKDPFQTLETLTTEWSPGWSKWMDEYCAICLDSFVDGSKVRMLVKCKHVFDAYCVDVWVQMLRHPCCPICKQPFVPPTTHKVRGSRAIRTSAHASSS